MKLTKIILTILLASTGMLYAQSEIEVVGKVVDAEGESLPGVNVIIRGTTKGTVTNVDGFYKITVADPVNAVLEFNYIGMDKKMERVGNRKTLNVTLVTSSYQLNEVVSVGYNTIKRRDLTGSVSSVNIQEMAKVPVTSVAQALAGRVSGVNVTQSEGDLDSKVSIKVRGSISLTQDNDPLYIIDGFPSESSTFAALTPGEIESIDVLKDASSTAIYGSRGANGVVVITTKKGIEGKVKVSYEGYAGIKIMANKLNQLSAAEFVLLDYERRSLNPLLLGKFSEYYGNFSDINTYYNTNKGVDWQDESFRQAFSQNHRISFSGGSKDINYYATYNYSHDDGLMVYSGQTKQNIRFKLDNVINKKTRLSVNLNYNDQETNGMGTSEGNINFGKLTHVLMYQPTMGLRVSDADFRDLPNVNDMLDDSGNTMQNPVASAKAELNKREYRNFSANGTLSYQIASGLSIKNTTGMAYYTRRNEQFFASNSVQALRSGGKPSGSIYNGDGQSFQTASTLDYNWKKGFSKLNVLLGQEFVSQWARWFQTSVSNFPGDEIGLNDLSLGIADPSASNFNDDDKLLSFFGRVFYNFKEKYLLTASFRADASSKFAAKNKWGYFPSASFAWRLSEENFIKKSGIFSDLKLRIGYGLAGNNRIPSYSSLALWQSVQVPTLSGTQTGYYPYSMPNDELRWEANNTFNSGLDIGFFNQRITVTPEFYINRSSNLLLNAALPGSSGHLSMIQNIGATQNTGVDITINTVNINTRDFSWNTALTFSHNNNKVLALGSENSSLWDSGWGIKQNDFMVKVGEPIGLIYGYKTIGLYQTNDFEINPDGTFKMDAQNRYVLKPGVQYNKNAYPKPGFWKFEDNGKELDENGNPLITENDKQVIGRTQAKFYGGLNNTFRYKWFDLSVFLNYSIGNDVLNATKLYTSLFGWTNKTTLASNSTANRWVTIDGNGDRIIDATTLAELNQGKTVAQWENMQTTYLNVHSWGVEDGSFLRINNVTLGYTVPEKLIKKLKINSMRMYVTGSNLFTFTNYSGYDPEVSTRNTSGLTPGVDWSAYPRNRSMIFGLNLTF